MEKSRSQILLSLSEGFFDTWVEGGRNRPLALSEGFRTYLNAFHRVLQHLHQLRVLLHRTCPLQLLLPRLTRRLRDGACVGFSLVGVRLRWISDGAGAYLLCRHIIDDHGSGVPTGLLEEHDDNLAGRGVVFRKLPPLV